MKWNEYFIMLADSVRKKSKDRSTRVGAVIATKDFVFKCSGYNGFPRGIDDNNDRFHERPLKYKLSCHAEANAIFLAAREGVSIKGCNMYITHNPVKGICTECAKAIIQAGINAVVGPSTPFKGNSQEWGEDLMIAYNMLQDAGVTLAYDPSLEIRDDRED